MGYEPSGRGPELIAIYVVFLVLATVTTALRCYVRVFMLKIFGWDDYFAVLSWICFAFWGSFAITGAYHGTGQHVLLINPPTEVPIGLKWWWACEPVYVLSTIAIKISIGMMLLRLVVEKSHRLLIWIVVGATQVYSVAFFFLFIFQCNPPKYFWTRFQGDTHGSCLDPKVTVDLTYCFSALTVVCDLTLAIMPYFLVRKLQMNSRTKFMVAIILALGSVACVATIVRLPYIHTLADMSDFLYATTDVAIWSCCETGLSIVASSAATLKPLFKDFLSRSKFFGGSSSLPMTNKDTWKASARSAGVSDGRKYIRTTSLEGGATGSSRTDTDGDSTTNITKTLEVDVRRVGPGGWASWEK